jgi:hypothetical protein
MPGAGASPPTGNTPMAQPSSSPGSEAAAVAKIQAAVDALSQALPLIQDKSGPRAKEVLKAIERLSKLAAPGQAAPGRRARLHQRAPLDGVTDHGRA